MKKTLFTSIILLITSTLTFAQKDKVSFVNKSASIENVKPLVFEIKYEASKDRDVYLELKNPKTNKWIAGTLVKVEKGEGTISIKLNTKDPFKEGSNYQLALSIRPRGADWKETITSDVIKPFTIGGTTDNSVVTKDNVHFLNLSNEVESTKQLNFDVEYAAKEDREIIIELKNFKTNKWIAGAKKKITKGRGTIQLKLNNKDGFAKGDNYQVNVSIRPLNSTWKETINKDTAKPFIIK